MQFLQVSINARATYRSGLPAASGAMIAAMAVAFVNSVRDLDVRGGFGHGYWTNGMFAASS